MSTEINVLFKSMQRDDKKEVLKFELKVMNYLQSNSNHHWPSFYNVVTGKTLALPNLIALQHIPLSPAGVIAKRPAPIALPNSCAA